MRFGAHVRWRWDTAESRQNPRIGFLVRDRATTWRKIDEIRSSVQQNEGASRTPSASRVRQRRSSPREAVKAEVPI